MRSSTACWNSVRFGWFSTMRRIAALYSARSAWRAWRARPALGRVQRAPLDAGAIGRTRHRAAQRVDFLDQVALADAADGRIAAHLPERFDVVRQQQRARAHARGRERGFGAGMAAADDDDVEFRGSGRGNGFHPGRSAQTWAEFDRRVDRVARGLLAIGMRRGDHFGVWSTNWPEWVILQFATARVGVVLVTINPSYRAAELQYALAQSDFAASRSSNAIGSSCYFDLLREACPELDTARPGVLHCARFPRLQWVVSHAAARHIRACSPGKN